MNKHLFFGTIIFFNVFLVAGCATDPGISNKVNAAVASLTLAEQTYVRTCRDVPTLVICVDPLKSQIKALDMKAYNAVKLAEQSGTQAMLGFAIEAITEFTQASSAR